MSQKTAVIIGAGPAGLTAAYELLQKTAIKPIVFEMSDMIGGIARTINYKGNRIDIGGHRFFSKSDRIMKWWNNILPFQDIPSNTSNGANPEKTDRVMLIRNRLSRIFFLRKFFDYPVKLNLNTIANLGIVRIMKIGLSYIKIRLFPIKEEKSLEDFFINRFGMELYKTFFKDYTEKVWGVSCTHIKPEWGAQRIKGLSITKTILHAIKIIISQDKSISQKSTETSLIEQFMYPKFGPGQMWEEVARIIQEKGGGIYINHKVEELQYYGNEITSVTVKDLKTNETKIIHGNYFFSTMPVKELILGMGNMVPHDVREVAKGLIYRDFITVGLLLKKLKVRNNIVPDNWIYIQEKDVKVGRLQIFNNWSPYMVKDPNTVWVGLEYFCNEGDNLWETSDEELKKLAACELAKIDIIEENDVLDSTVIRMPKTYPAYFGTYDRFHLIREFVNKLENLFLVGRNGMHKYNNQDHSMLTAMVSVENIVNGVKTKDNIWEVNTEMEYHEEK